MARTPKKTSPGKNDGGPETTALPEDDVRLKPFMGIKPGHYLACLYAAALLLILFFVLLYPGISKPGSLVTVKTEPWGAAVLVDGVYMEASPCEIFIPRGRHEIALTLPGFNPKSIDKDIGGRLFASLFFPRKTEIRETLEAGNPKEAFAEAAAEYAAWTFAGEPSAAYQIPLSLSEGAYRLGPAARDPAVKKYMEDTVSAAARFAATRAGLRDLIRAKTLVDNGGISPSPLSLLASAAAAIDFLEKNPGAALWLGAALEGDAQSALTSSDWYAAAAGANNAAKPELRLFSGDGVQNTRAGGFLRAGPLDFVLIPGGLDLLGGNFPGETEVGDFYICETVVSAAAWERFLEEEPMWKSENTEALIKEGLVSGAPPNASDFPGAPAEGVSGISWHAARAFCEWLSGSLPPRFASWEVRLPAEAEWEYAAKAGALDSGLFWEWCEDPYVPLSFLSAPPDAISALGSPERALRGGAWVNNAGSSVGNETRASLPPAFSSPFVSFRPVIVPGGARE